MIWPLLLLFGFQQLLTFNRIPSSLSIFTFPVPQAAKQPSKAWKMNFCHGHLWLKCFSSFPHKHIWWLQLYCQITAQYSEILQVKLLCILQTLFTIPCTPVGNDFDLHSLELSFLNDILDNENSNKEDSGKHMKYKLQVKLVPYRGKVTIIVNCTIVSRVKKLWDPPNIHNT